VTPLPRSLPTVVLPAGQQLWRIHPSELHPVWFGPEPGSPPHNRFDAPNGEYRVCYLGDSLEVSFAETLIRQPRERLIGRAALESRSATPFPLTRDVKLVRFHGPGLVRLGLGADVAHGHPYDRCQQIALELWQHPDQVDGIEYRSRWDNDRLCFAMFDRAGEALDYLDRHDRLEYSNEPDPAVSLTRPDVIGPLLRLYDIGII